MAGVIYDGRSRVTFSYTNGSEPVLSVTLEQRSGGDFGDAALNDIGRLLEDWATASYGSGTLTLDSIQRNEDNSVTVTP